MAQNKQLLIFNYSMKLGKIYPDQLFKSGILTTPTFSFAYRGYHAYNESYVDFGEPIDSRANFMNKATIGINDDFFWSAFI